ncbi:MAG: PAS domain S-box protein, partial [Rubrobacter sp.]|nr:PAS domain S-box protein [Rubrobacter sp.]
MSEEESGVADDISSEQEYISPRASELIELNSAIKDDSERISRLREDIDAILDDEVQIASRDSLSTIEQAAEENIGDVYTALTVLLLAGLLVGAGSAALIGRGILGPVSSLKEGARRIGGGDLDHRIQTGSKDEMGELATAFNEMAASRQSREEEVRESERRFRQLFEQSVDALLVHDSRGRIVDCNEEAARSLGYTREELLTLSVADFATNLTESLDPRNASLWQRAMQGEVSQQNAIHLGEHRRKDGASFPVEVRVSGVDYGGERMILAAARDITERRAAESRLKAQHAVADTLARSGAVSEAAPEVLQSICYEMGWEIGELWEIDRKTSSGATSLRCSHIWVSEEIEAGEFASVSNSLELSRGEGLPGKAWESGDPVWVLGPEEIRDSPRIAAAENAGLQTALAFPVLIGEETVAVMGFYTTSRREIGEETLEMMSTMGSQLGQFFERKRAEASLRESEERLRSITSEAPVVIFQTNLEGRFEFVAGKGMEALGINPEDLVGESFHDAFADSPDVIEAMRRAYAGEEFSTTVEVQGVTFETFYRPQWEGPEVAGLIGVATDITERRQTEAALRESEERYRTILQSIEDGYFEVDLTGSLKFFNDALTHILRLPRERLMGANNRD